MSGDFEFQPDHFNSNGIVVTPDSKTLIIVQSDLGRLYKVNPISGHAIRVDIGVPQLGKDGGDGLVLVGRMLYIINYYNEVVRVELNHDMTKGVVKPSITNPLLDQLTTGVRFGRWLYVVNAKLPEKPTPDTSYRVTRVNLE